MYLPAIKSSRCALFNYEMYIFVVLNCLLLWQHIYITVESEKSLKKYLFNRYPNSRSHDKKLLVYTIDEAFVTGSMEGRETSGHRDKKVVLMSPLLTEAPVRTIWWRSSSSVLCADRLRLRRLEEGSGGWRAWGNAARSGNTTRRHATRHLSTSNTFISYPIQLHK